MPKELIDKYVLVIMEYIHNINSSDIIKNMDDNDIVLSGLKCIIHVFKLTFHITGCVQSTISVTQKAIAYYLEYVEQMQKTQFVLNANITDAVTYVYSKTISELHNNDISPDNFENFTSAQPFLNYLDYVTTTILWTSNPDILNIQRLELAHHYLQKAIMLDVGYPNIPVFKILQMLQDYVWMDYPTYYELAGEFIKQVKKRKSITKDGLRNNMLYFLAHLKDKTLDEIAVQEGYKSKYDIVSRLLVSM